MAYGYTIDPRPADLGGGWRLRLTADGEEVGGGVFPAGPSETEKDAAYAEALAEAYAWTSTRGADEEDL